MTDSIPSDEHTYMPGTWTLTAPDGRTWTGSSPLKACSAELNERRPAIEQLRNLLKGIDEIQEEERQAWRKPAAQWLRDRADQQDLINKECPAHAEAYESWRMAPIKLRMYANEMESGQ